MHRTKYTIGLFFVFLSLVFACILLFRILNIDPEALVVPITETFSQIDIPFLETKQSKNESLAKAVQTVKLNPDDTYGIVIQNFKTNETYAFNEHRHFQSASLYKLWIMAVVYDEIQNGRLRETDTLQQEIPILNEKFAIASEDAELTEGSISLSVTGALERMITVSDNYAALLLSEKVRLSIVSKFLSSHGFTESKIGTDGSMPTTTPSDIAKFFTLIHEGKLINREYDTKMLNLLKGQKLNNKIPKNLPENTVVAHKTGELNSLTHDAGIVFAKNGDYVIAVLSESTTPDNAEQTIADLSETIYRYFTK